MAKVARQYGISHRTATNHLHLAGVKIRLQKTGLPEAEVANAVALREQGWTYKAIGERYGCSHTAVREAIRRASSENDPQLGPAPK
ncbi:helix-turn-helix domain-containing protein [Jatrophihabitans telluris]|uniref:Helix-turn-helix domain-containing protein n=1 Tax=Jatrophihabitans telluris TaxID=2038343 RepID=A0ABY4QXM0_9ACTN|nr:helix-turn-helix domain-containing protein [Jatrophihabitans telluris]UQX88253.1 helix-turn-helix domain-containing protein [Jatrophihabitans telluris]